MQVDSRAKSLRVLAEWEHARAAEIMRRVGALLDLQREHMENAERYIERAKTIEAV